MRDITREAINYFLAGEKFSKSNTSVVVSDTGKTVALKLHGNTIALLENNVLSITNAGWQSNTTKERLNALPNVSIYQKKGIWYLNGEAWNGKWIEIN